MLTRHLITDLKKPAGPPLAFRRGYASEAYESTEEHLGADDIENLRECSEREILLCLHIGGVGDLYISSASLTK